MLLQADEMIYDNVNNRVTAKGNVEIYYGNYTLLADQVIYDRNANTLAAQGQRAHQGPEGAIITSNQMTLTDDFRDGFINALRVVTKDDTRIVAQTRLARGWQRHGVPERLVHAVQTLRGQSRQAANLAHPRQKIIHRKDEATFTYRNAFFDFFGVPVLWAPYFQSADPDGEAEVRLPHAAVQPISQELGTTVTVPYYFALADNYDFTFVPMYTSKGGTLLQGSGASNWRMAGTGWTYTASSTTASSMPAGSEEDFRGSIETRASLRSTPIGPGAGTSLPRPTALSIASTA